MAPKITKLSWGEVKTDDGSFKDAKLWPGGVRGWDWNETGTSHSPGIQPADVQELLDNGAKTVILSRGQQGRLRVMDETIQAVEDAGGEAIVLGTEQAVERYNELAEADKPVGALIHSTC